MEEEELELVRKNISAALLKSLPYTFCRSSSPGPASSEISIGVLVYSGAIVITSTLGLVGNSLSAVVLCSGGMPSSYALVLTALTVSDTIQLIGYFIFLGAPALRQLGLHFDLAGRHVELSRLLVLLGVSAFTASSYLTVLVSLERYTAVCKPFESLRLFPSRRRTCAYVFAISAFSILFNVVKWWELEPCHHRPDIIGNLTMLNTSVPAAVIPGLVERVGRERVEFQYSSLYRNPVYARVYVDSANILINFLLPFILLLLANLRMYRAMMEARKQQRMIAAPGQRVGSSSSDNSITSMLVIVVAVFCFCQAWYPVVRTVHYWCRHCVRTLRRLSTYLECLNASINFLIYCVWGSKFRAELRKVVTGLSCCESFRENSGRGSMSRKSRTSAYCPTESHYVTNG